jgi:hypothetical protein
MSEYTPDSWVVVKLAESDAQDPVYKVLAGWSGSYLYGDSWKLNSGITKIERDGPIFRFHGTSGSVYVCHELAYGLSRITSSMMAQFRSIADETPGTIVEMLTPADAFSLTIN